jgi:hypothetical protein
VQHPERSRVNARMEVVPSWNGGRLRPATDARHGSGLITEVCVGNSRDTPNSCDAACGAPGIAR